MMNKKRLLYAFALGAAITLIILNILFQNLKEEENRHLGNLNNYTPLAVVNDNIIYNYFMENGTFVIGCYDGSTKTEKDCYFEDDFYISSGISVVNDEMVYLPITLTDGEHSLLEIDSKNDNVISVLKEYSSYPIDTIATMNGEIFILSMNASDNGSEETIIKRYSCDGNNSKEILKKEYTNGIGEKIRAFSCYDGSLYALVEYANNSNVYCVIEEYSAQNMILKETIDLEDSIEKCIRNNGIAQFYCFGNYMYFRDYSDEGYIGEIKGKTVEKKYNISRLRVVNDNGCGVTGYQFFYVRDTADLYVLSLKNGIFSHKRMPLPENESIRSAVANSKKIIISILDGEDEENFTTKDTLVLDIDKDIIDG